MRDALCIPSLHIVHQPYIKKQNPRSKPHRHLHTNQLYIEKQIPHLKLRDEFWPRSYHVVPCFERVVFHRVANLMSQKYVLAQTSHVWASQQKIPIIVLHNGLETPADSTSHIPHTWPAHFRCQEDLPDHCPQMYTTNHGNTVELPSHFTKIINSHHQN